MADLCRVVHEIPPVYDARSRVLILGTIPSPKSREYGFFYGHPQNRFWKVLAALFQRCVGCINQKCHAQRPLPHPANRPHPGDLHHRHKGRCPLSKVYTAGDWDSRGGAAFDQPRKLRLFA